MPNPYSQGTNLTAYYSWSDDGASIHGRKFYPHIDKTELIEYVVNNATSLTITNTIDTVTATFNYAKVE